MGSVNLKSNIHKIVDRIESEYLLQTIYDFLKIRETNKPNQLWDSLTEHQKQEVLISYEESNNEKNLIDRDQVFKRSDS